MSQYVEGPVKTFTAGGAIAQHLRVSMSGGKLAVAGATSDDVGTAENAAFADGDEIGVRLRTAAGTCKMVAAGAVTLHAKVYQAASGKIDDTATGKLVGIALEAAGSGGSDVIEVLRLDAVEAPVLGVGAGYKVARGETALDGSNPTAVVTGLTTCIAFVATLKGSTAPADGTSTLTAVISGGDANVYAWTNTGGNDPTLAASTGTESFYWVAIGT